MRVAMTLLFAAYIALLAGCEAKRDMPAVEAIASQSAPRGMPSDLPVRNAFSQASQVRLFVNTSYDSDGMPAYSEPKGRALSGAQRKAFEATLQIDPIPDELAACFIPHHFFRYYDSQGKEIGQISVCFCCNGAQVSGASGIAIGPDQWLSADYDKLEQFVKSLDLPTDVQCD
jgi:hypothetical protein